MTPSRQTLCIFYGIVALLALIGTWGNNMQYLPLGFVGANTHFWQETLANPASRSITVDVMFLFLAASVWMLQEARRLSMKGAWMYIIFGMLVAISVTFPIFMINRERALAKLDGGAPAGSLSVGEVLLLAACAAMGCGYTWVALAHP